jgi:Uma2 family endonuclease
MNTLAEIAEQRVVIDGVRWSTYSALAEEGGRRRGRMFFDDGVLEIMSPGLAHGNIASLIGRMIDTYTEVQGIDIVSAASTTFKREDLNRGFEADRSYYVQHAHRVAAKRSIELPRDPAPDLVVEVDITRSSMTKEPVFHALGVSEVWRFAEQRLTVRIRDEHGYIDSQSSSVLPGFPLATAQAILDQHGTLSETRLVQQFRQSLAPPPPGGL